MGGEIVVEWAIAFVLAAVGYGLSVWLRHALRARRLRAGARQCRDELGDAVTEIERASVGEPAVLAGRLVVDEGPCERYEDGQPAAAAAVVLAEGLGAASKQVAADRAKRLVLELADGKLELAGPVRLLRGTHEWWASTAISSVPAALRGRLDGDVEWSQPHCVGSRSIADGAPVVAAGMLERESGASEAVYRSAAIEYRLVPEPDADSVRVTAAKPPTLRVWRRWRDGRALVVAVLALGIGYWGSISLPTQQLEAVKQDSNKCFDDLDAAPGSEPTRCLELASSPRLWLPLMFPRTREQALRRQATIRGRTAWRQLDYYSTIELDAAKRAQAARAYFDANDDDTIDERIGTLQFIGAHRSIGELPMPDDFSNDAYRAAIWLGEIERATALAKRRARGEFPYAHEKLRGAWLCLRGERTAGLEALAVADRQSVSGQYQTRVAILMCGGTKEEVGLDPTRLSIFGTLPALLRARAPAFHRGHRAAFFRSLADGTYSQQGLVVRAAALAEGDWTLEAMLSLVAKTTLHNVSPRESSYLSPDAIWAFEDALPMPFDPEQLDTAAARLAKAAEAAPEVLEIDRLNGPYEIAEAATKHPRAVLRHFAWVMRVEAAAEWVRQGKLDRTIQSAAAADELALPELAWMTAAAYVAAGDAAAALAAVGRYRPDTEADATLRDARRAHAELLRTHALAALDRWDDAYAAAKQAHDAAAKLPDSGNQYGTAGNLRLGAAWLRAALAWRSGHRDDPIADVPLPSRLHGKLGHDQPFEAIGMVLALVRSEPPQRRKGRQQTTGCWLDAPHALAAAMYLVGQAARDEGDVEVYLDRMFARQMEERLRRASQARALAARWRGDQAAAELWQARQAQLTALVTDGPSAFLAHEAGL